MFVEDLFVVVFYVLYCYYCVFVYVVVCGYLVEQFVVLGEYCFVIVDLLFVYQIGQVVLQWGGEFWLCVEQVEYVEVGLQVVGEVFIIVGGNVLCLGFFLQVGEVGREV